jgi:hypothetical protein
MYQALRGAWQDYCNISKEQIPDKKRIRRCKLVIRKLQDKPRKPITELMFEAFGL